VGGPAGRKEAAKRCTEATRTVGPTLIGVGGPAGRKEAAAKRKPDRAQHKQKRCTEATRHERLRMQARQGAAIN
jgi:hypothetical protein